MPAFTIPFLAWAATAAELSLGIGLILGVWRRWVALGAAGLLFLFGTAMAISLGIKSPLDFSVYSASAGALLLFLSFRPTSQGKRPERSGQHHWIGGIDFVGRQTTRPKGDASTTRRTVLVIVPA